MDIELRHIHKRFPGVHANDDISFTVKGGRIVGVLGENGAGKSTLMKILSGYQPADSGDILLNGQRETYHRPEAAIAAGIGMLQQDPLDVPAFTVLENMVYGQPGSVIFKRREAQKQLGELCGRFGFALDPDTPIASLSIGQRQQLEIVRLRALGIKTLILDEPTTGISAEQKTLLFDTLRALAKTDGMSVLLVSHKLEDVIALCDEVVVLRAGMLVGEAQMPVTKAELVSMMFGQELAPQTRERVALGEPVLSLDTVTLRGKRVSVEDLTLHVRAGEVIGLAGLDGSGQELIVRACAGLLKPHGGAVRVSGRDLSGKPYRDFLRAGVAFGAAGRL
ncbi:MAG: ATP-binding cassette domain-containing protein, partial [Anaerolineae bacterium]|nr:ATP-binding cassette domain-containing protein [Anaerolineae bacterium]